MVVRAHEPVEQGFLFLAGGVRVTRPARPPCRISVVNLAPS